MSKKKKIVVTICCFIALIGLGLFFYLFYLVNQKYPEPKLEEVKINKSVKYSHNPDFELEVIDFSILNQQELEKLYAPIFEEIRVENQKMAGFLVKIRVKNNSLQASSIEVQEFMIQSGAFSNGSDLYQSMFLNTKVNKGPYEPKEERVLILPFTVSENLLSNIHWKNIEQLKYKLVTSLYPVEQSILLN